MIHILSLVVAVLFSLLATSSVGFAQNCPNFSGHHTITMGEKGETLTFDLSQVGCETWTFANREFSDEKGNVTPISGTITRETDGQIHSDQYYGGHDRYCMKWLTNGSLQQYTDTETSTCQFASYVWQKSPFGKLERIFTGCVSTHEVLRIHCR